MEVGSWARDKGETGKGCGQEAEEKGGEAWDAPPELGGRGRDHL